MRRWIKLRRNHLVLSGVGLLFLGLTSCADKTKLSQQLLSVSFTQDYNPPVLDILWVLDSRSQFYSASGRDNIISEAQKFFTRLDGSTDDYQMGFITADMLIAQGQLQPTSQPVILKKNVGTIDQRVALFSSLLTQVSFNGKTGGLNESFAAANLALSNYFKPRTGVPLVLVFITDSDDKSPVPTTDSAVSYYSQKFLSFKNNQASLLKIYSINYEKLQSGQTINQNTRCVTEYNADIDLPGFQDRFFQLANAVGGSTGDICGSFSQQISLDGLKIKTLPSTFQLSSTPQVSSLQVDVSLSGQEVTNLTWTYDTANNQIVFNQAPPEGSYINITYLPQ
jgi:hypothetical protein